MPRIRTIKPEFPQSESMGKISREARLCFIQLWTLADDSGRLRGVSRMLASLLYPYDNDAPKLIDAWLAELSKEECIIRYEVDNQHYIQICNWCLHQKIDKPSASKLPPLANGIEDSSNGIEDSSEDQGSRIKDQGRDQGPKEAARAPFVHPTLEEVSAYCKERGGIINPEAWLAHYESNGWMVGKNHMKDWKKAVITWEHSEFNKQAAKQETEAEKIERMCEEGRRLTGR